MKKIGLVRKVQKILTYLLMRGRTLITTLILSAIFTEKKYSSYKHTVPVHIYSDNHLDY